MLTAAAMIFYFLASNRKDTYTCGSRTAGTL